jgi:hypothetical protein
VGLWIDVKHKHTPEYSWNLYVWTSQLEQTLLSYTLSSITFQSYSAVQPKIGTGNRTHPTTGSTSQSHHMNGHFHDGGIGFSCGLASVRVFGLILGTWFTTTAIDAAIVLYVSGA